MSFIRSLVFVITGFLVLAQSSSSNAQENPDNQPQIQPRKDGSAPPKQPQPFPQQDAKSQLPSGNQQQGESSSADSQVDFDAAPRAAEAPPTRKSEDERTFSRWDPHRAAKDVEVGSYYFKQKNYRAALERFNDALLYKPKDAEATYWLALTQEKLDLFSQADHNYHEYVKLLPSGPHASDAQAGIKRIGLRPEANKNPSANAEQDIQAGETYLSVNNFGAARDRFEEAVRLAPENAKACFRLAQSLRGLELIEPARLYFRKYLELDPHGPFAADAKKAITEITYIVGK